MSGSRETTDPIAAARRLLGERRQIGDPTVDKVNAEVFGAAAYVLAVAQPGAQWICSLGHRHERPERMNTRGLTRQAERLRNECIGRSTAPTAARCGR